MKNDRTTSLPEIVPNTEPFDVPVLVRTQFASRVCTPVAVVVPENALAVCVSVIDSVPLSLFVQPFVSVPVHVHVPRHVPVSGVGAVLAPWVTVIVCPATVAVPLRAAPVFCENTSETLPDPMPLAGDVWMKGALPADVQLHPAALAVTCTSLLIVVASTLMVDVDTVKLHPD